MGDLRRCLSLAVLVAATRRSSRGFGGATPGAARMVSRASVAWLCSNYSGPGGCGVVLSSSLRLGALWLAARSMSPRAMQG